MQFIVKNYFQDSFFPVLNKASEIKVISKKDCFLVDDEKIVPSVNFVFLQKCGFIPFYIYNNTKKEIPEFTGKLVDNQVLSLDFVKKYFSGCFCSEPRLLYLTFVDTDKVPTIEQAQHWIKRNNIPPLQSYNDYKGTKYSVEWYENLKKP